MIRDDELLLARPASSILLWDVEGKQELADR